MKLDDIRKLHQKKYRQKFGRYLVEGEHLILELQNALAHSPSLESSEIYVTEAYQDWKTPLLKHQISTQQMRQISDTKSPPGIIAAVPLPNESKNVPEQYNNSTQEKAIYLYEVQDPGNLGTIIRTLAWFGNFRLLLSPNSVDPFNPKVVRASMGAMFHLPVEMDVSLDSLDKRFKTLGALDMEGRPLSAPEFSQCDCYVFGNEARGVPRSWLNVHSHQPFTISGSGLIESLNLASAVNICVYELRR